MAPTSYRVLALPKLQHGLEPDRHGTALAQKYREFRLHALKTSAEAFATTYESESQRGLDHTIERLSNHKATNYVALESSVAEIIAGYSRTDRVFSTFARAEWFGMIVLLGPDSGQTPGTLSARQDPFSSVTLPSSTQDSDHIMKDADINPPSLYFHLNGVFVNPKARRTGLGRALIEAALKGGRSIARVSGASFCCSIFVDSKNEAAQRLYASAGFSVTGAESYVQQPRELVVGESEQTERLALRMDLVCDVA